jgi:outer membrane protein assembly factor BamD (BamD/ComL family)
VQAYRNLGMTDLAADAERVYDANYPANSTDVTAKKSWWRRIL